MQIFRRIIAGAGMLMACAFITLISMVGTKWVKDHPTGAVWLGIALFIGAVLCFIFWFSTRDGKQFGTIFKIGGNFAGRDYFDTKISKSIVGDEALDKILKARRTPTPSRLHIQSAEYISVHDPKRFVAVEECLRQLIDDDKLVFEIQNHNFVAGGKNYVPKDPHTNHPKKLSVTYSFNGGPLQAAVEMEGAVLNLPPSLSPASSPKPEVALEIEPRWRVLAFNEINGVWSACPQDNEGARQAFTLLVRNPVPNLGENGIPAPLLSAHLKIRFAAISSYSHQISRTYWIDRSENKISIGVGHEASIVVGAVDKDSFWVYENPLIYPILVGLPQ